MRIAIAELLKLKAVKAIAVTGKFVDILKKEVGIDKMQETDDVLKEKLQAEVKKMQRKMQAEEEGADKMQEDKEAMTLSEELNVLWDLSERCLDELEWMPQAVGESGEVKAHKTIVQAMFVRCQSIRENLQIILDTVREL